MQKWTLLFVVRPKKKRNTLSTLDTNENDRRIKLDMSPAVEKICVALDELLSLRDEGIEVFKKIAYFLFLIVQNGNFYIFPELYSTISFR